jgi:hypothetical protein
MKYVILLALTVFLLLPKAAYADVHNRPVTTATLSPDPTTVANDLSFYTDPVTVALSATADTGYSIQNTYYKIDGGAQEIYSGAFTVSGTGKHSIEYWSVDNSGIEESPHNTKNFTISYQSGTISQFSQSSGTFNAYIHLDNIQPYLDWVSSSTGISGANCNNDESAVFDIYNATTGALVAEQTESQGGHCFNSDSDPSTGNQLLLFSQLLLHKGTYFIHYSGGSYDWITDNFVYNPAPTTTISLATQNSDGTYSDPTIITLSATTAVGTTLQSTYYTIDSGNQQTYSGPFSVSGGGAHTLTYYSVDSDGTQETSNTKHLQ